MTTRPTQHEIDEAFAEIASKIAINDARKAAGARDRRFDACGLVMTCTCPPSRSVSPAPPPR